MTSLSLFNEILHFHKKRSRSLDLEIFDPEINKTIRQLRKNIEALNFNIANQDNEENKVLKDYAMPSIHGVMTSIRRPLIQAAHFEIKPTIIQMIQNTI